MVFTGISRGPGYTARMNGEDDEDRLEEPLSRQPAGSREDPDLMEAQRASDARKPSRDDPDMLDESEASRRKEREQASLKATGRVAQTSLPMGEQEDDDPMARRAEIQARIDELESTLKYMGEGHPKRSAFEVQLRTMREMMRRIDEALRLAT